MDKKALRTELKLKEADFLASGTAVPEAEVIWARVEQLPCFRDARCVLVYMDIPGEVPTRDFIERWKGRKRFVLPLVAGDDLLLKEYDPELLVPGYKGILEPAENAVPVSVSELDMALVPGLAFSRMDDGRVLRMGRGKGFYDRLLPSLDCPSIAVGFSFRWLPSLPVDPWDVPLSGGVGD